MSETAANPSAQAPALQPAHSSQENAGSFSRSGPHALSGLVPLTHWGVIAAQGADAPQFLHGQLTHDFALLTTQTARLAGYCSPKGRLLASFVGWKADAEDPTVLLACSADLLPATLKRLSMFVMRAQCKLSDATATHTLWGVAGEAAHQLAQQARLGSDTWAKAEIDAAALGWSTGTDEAAGSATTVVRLPPATDDQGNPIARLLVCAPAAQVAPSATVVPALTLPEWQWLEVRSGVATVTLPVADTLVPQMLNYESVGGVNFKKGCYPGQEVVARSQFRGTLKRRTYRLTCAQALTAGQELFHSSDAEQPCGTVVTAAPHPGGNGWEALASLQIATTQTGSLHTQAAEGTELMVQTLPYALLEDI